VTVPRSFPRDAGHRAAGLVLGIETSCDETSVALVDGGVRVRSQCIASQIPLHERFGGVVPEVASRAHLRLLLPLIQRVLNHAGVTPDQIDAIAVTAGPGLVGALLVGVETAKALSLAWKLPVVGVHHVAAHLLSVGLEGAGPTLFLDQEGLPQPEVGFEAAGGKALTCQEWTGQEFPYLGLVVSGGHTSLIAVNDGTSFRLLGSTIDDAAGECFDKVAKLLHLRFPGGPALEKAAQFGRANQYELPRPLCRSGDLRFSFSGLKTSVLTLVQQLGGAEAVRNQDQVLADVCACVQHAVADVLAIKSAAALEQTGFRRLAITGGVACNHEVRRRLGLMAASHGVSVAAPPPILCTDNAAMVARAGWEVLQQQAWESQGMGFDARAEWPINQASDRSAVCESPEGSG
jgi:N6-L-threonylcarbamoyladenine synthase